MIIVHYEVYVLEGRGWMLQARFPRPERDTAIYEAKELEHSLGARVRVVRETYYSDDNSFEEAEVYCTSGTPGAKQPSQQQKARPSPPTAHGVAAKQTARPAAKAIPSRRPVPQPRRSAEDAAAARTMMIRLLSIIALGVAAALLAINITPEAILLLWKVGFNLTLTSEVYGRLQVVVFTVTFLMVAVPLGARFLSRKPKRRKAAAPPPPDVDWAAISAASERERAVKKSLDKLAAKALADEERRAVGGNEPEEPADGPPSQDMPGLAPGPAEAQPAQRRPLAEEAVKERRDDKTDRGEKAAKADKAEKDEGATVESLHPLIMRFLDGAISQAKVLVPNMDSLTKFALHLYVTGAVETLCDFRRLGDGAKAKMVGVALETLGTRGELARKFYDKLEEYLLEPRYLGMVQAGRDAMGDFMLGDENGAHRALRDAILEWSRKGDKKAQIVTIMFTDMVGSTDMTQSRGDAAAQEVVRRHNSIVRGALAQFGGKEIKHTGDGIMASFATAAAAVEAAIVIQRQVDQHNQRLPNQALHLRVGLNAGEPIEEEDDLFGSTVQLAARVCAATNADQILCTGVVKDLTVGKGAARFLPTGEKYLKGFKDAVALFEVAWN